MMSDQKSLGRAALALAALVLSACSSVGIATQGTHVPSQPLVLASPTRSPEPSTPIPTPTPQVTAAPIEIRPTDAVSTPDLSPTPNTISTAVPPDTPPISGSFDVYLGAPNEAGYQLLRWVETTTGEKITEISIRSDDHDAVRAGQYIYYYAPGTRQPQRVNTSGAILPLGFASPPPGTLFYQFLPSPTGEYLTWVAAGPDGVFKISLSDAAGTDVRQVGGDTLLEGEQVRLLRVTNDGSKVFYERRPISITHETLFAGRYSIFMLDTRTGRVYQLPGEPACGDMLVCDAHISPDGAFLIRTLPPQVVQQPVVVTNLVTSSVVVRFTPPVLPTGGFSIDIGYPFLTPSGELIYEQAYGPPGLESYRLILANLDNGDQRALVELGHEKHRPLGWAADGVTLLTTREPQQFDTWQVNSETGAMRQIAGMLFLGHIEEPPLTP